VFILKTEEDIITCIADARNFHKHGMYDEALTLLSSFSNAIPKSLYLVEIYKLMSFNYRKLEDNDLALYNISSALSLIEKLRTDSYSLDLDREYAICLMNKGVILEVKNQIEKAIPVYSEALNIFTVLYSKSEVDEGVIINALITLGTAYYNQKNYKNARKHLKDAIPYFAENKENDRQKILGYNKHASRDR